MAEGSLIAELLGVENEKSIIKEVGEVFDDLKTILNKAEKFIKKLNEIDTGDEETNIKILSKFGYQEVVLPNIKDHYIEKIILIGKTGENTYGMFVYGVDEEKKLYEIGKTNTLKLEEDDSIIEVLHKGILRVRKGKFRIRYGLPEIEGFKREIKEIENGIMVNYIKEGKNINAEEFEALFNIMKENGYSLKNIIYTEDNKIIISFETKN